MWLKTIKLCQIVLLLIASLVECSSATTSKGKLNEAEIKHILDQVHPKVDIHLHLEGSLMDATAYELLK